MKLGKNVLLEIVDIVRIGLVEQRDISEMLREIDVRPKYQEEERNGVGVGKYEEVLVLSDEYLLSKGRPLTS